MELGIELQGPDIAILGHVACVYYYGAIVNS